MLVVKNEDFECMDIQEIMREIEHSEQYEEIRHRAMERSETTFNYINTIATHLFYEKVDFIDNDIY
jgi:hypothetical protein